MVVTNINKFRCVFLKSSLFLGPSPKRSRTDADCKFCLVFFSEYQIVVIFIDLVCVCKVYI